MLNLNYRNLYGGYSSIHGSQCVAQPGIHWNSVCLLHGGKCCDIPAICVGGGDQSMADALLLSIILIDIYHIHIDMAFRSGGAWEGGDVGVVHRGCCSNTANIPMHGPAGQET